MSSQTMYQISPASVFASRVGWSQIYLFDGVCGTIAFEIGLFRLVRYCNPHPRMNLPLSYPAF